MICLVCFNTVQKFPGSGSEVDRRVCTTLCGHIYHSYCINRVWRNVLKNTPLNTPVRYECPTCHRSFDEAAVFRLYPAEDQQDGVEDPRDTIFASLQKEKEQLTELLRQKDEQVEEARATFQQLKIELGTVDINNNQVDETKMSFQMKDDEAEEGQ